MRHIFIDTETTGFSPAHGHRVVEVAAVLCENGAPVAQFHRYLNPERFVPEEVQEVHGLSDEFLADKPLFADVADEFIRFVRDSTVVMHNAPFDQRFLDMELDEAGKPILQDIVSKIICSLRWARANVPDLESYNMDALCMHYGISRNARGYHGALTDAQMLAKLYYRMGGE